MDPLDEALAAHARAQQVLQTTREALHAAIRDALRNGDRQIDLVHKTGYTREHIRRIARELRPVARSR
jgi:Arc/MetJ family transcription regulator